MSENLLRNMKKLELKVILNEKIKSKALKYLLSLRGSMGSLIKYSSIQMSPYLLLSD